MGCPSDSRPLKNKFLTKAKANYGRGRVGCPSDSRPLKNKFLSQLKLKRFEVCDWNILTQSLKSNLC